MIQLNQLYSSSLSLQLIHLFLLKSLKHAFIEVGHFFFLIYMSSKMLLKLSIFTFRTGPFIIASAAYNIKGLTSITCHTCHQHHRTEYILPILHIPLLKDSQTSLTKVLKAESLIGSNAPYCHICSGLRESDSKLSLTIVEIS